MSRFNWRIMLYSFAIIIAVVPLVFSGYMILSIAEDELRSNLNDKLLLNALNVSDSVDEYFEDWLRSLELITTGMGDPQLTTTERINFLKNSFKNIDDAIAGYVYVGDGNGNFKEALDIINKDDPMEYLDIDEAKNFVTQEYLSSVSINNYEVLSFVNRDELFPVIIIPFTLPDHMEGRLAVVFSAYKIRHYLSTNLTFQEDGSGESVGVVDENGNYLYYTNKSLQLKELTTSVKSLIKEGHRVSTVSVVKHQDEQFVGSYTFTKTAPYGIIYMQNAEAAFTPVNKILATQGFWIFMGVLFAIIGALLFSRAIRTPVEKMSMAAGEIATGNFDVRLVHNAKDPLGRLALSLNKMAEALKKNFKQIELQKQELEEYSKHLEDKVEERTEKLKKTNKDLKSAYLRVLELNNEKDSILGIAAHDLKNPLGAIKGYGTLIMEDVKDEELKDFSEMIIHSSDRMLNIINTLLDVNRIEQGQVEIKYTNLNASGIITSIINENKKKAEKKDIKLLADLDESIVFEYDAFIFGQICDNLISNALKFSPPEKRVFVSITKVNGFVELRVKDEGPGIAIQEQDKLFKKFSRLSARPTGDESSTGLGLSIVKGYIDITGGQIHCNSKQDEGAEFVVILPQNRPEEVV